MKRHLLKRSRYLENNEISINYVHTWEILNRKKIVINNIFAFKVAFDITRSDDKIEPQTVKECWHRNDWSIWKNTIHRQLNLLAKYEVFGLVVHMENNEISINYVHTWEILNRKKIIINNIVAFKVAFGITRSDDKSESQTLKEYWHKNDWSMWKNASL